MIFTNATSEEMNAVEKRLFSSGLAQIVLKELADHLHSKRFAILFALVAAASLAAIYVASGNIRAEVEGAGPDAFVFLKLFTVTGSSLPSAAAFIGFIGPLAGLALGFDAINGERVRGTLSRILSQPIHRDALIHGKFIAALIIVMTMIFSLGLMVAGLGLIAFGVPPSVEEVLRLISFLLLTVVYIAFWLAVSLLFSILFKQTATAALAGIALWLFLTFFSSTLANLMADAWIPIQNTSTPEQVLLHERVRANLARISPTQLYGEASATLLDPTVRSLQTVFLTTQVDRIVAGTLDFGQSLLLVWPHLTGMVAATMICFAISYIVFMRQEIRAG